MIDDFMEFCYHENRLLNRTIAIFEKFKSVVRLDRIFYSERMKHRNVT